MLYRETLKKKKRDLRWRRESGKEKITYIDIQYRYECISNMWKTAVKRRSRENRFKTQQERLESKNDKDRGEAWLCGCAASNLRLCKKDWAPSLRAGAGRLALRRRVDSNHLPWSLPATRFNDCQLSVRALESISFLRERILLFLQWACR